MRSENGRSIGEDPSLKNALIGLKISRKKRTHSFLDLVVSRPSLRHLAQIHGLLLFFSLSPFMCWVTRRLHSSFALALPPPLTQVLPPTQIVPLPAPPLPLKTPSKETPTRLGSPTRSIPLNRWTGGLPRPHGHWRVCCSVDGACDEVDWGWEVELIGEDQEVVLNLSLLLERSILGLCGWVLFTGL